MASVKMLTAFNKKVIKAIIELGAKPYPNQSFCDQYFIETKAGKLDITLHREDKPSKIYSIFCRFEDPKKATEVLTPYNASNLNKYSGKWNYHMSNDKELFAQFIECLTEIL